MPISFRLSLPNCKKLCIVCAQLFSLRHCSATIAPQPLLRNHCSAFLQSNSRLRRRRTTSVERVKGCVIRSGRCATPSVSEDSIIHLSTGSPSLLFGHHPRLCIVCPLWGQWAKTVASIFTPTRKKMIFVVTALSCCCSAFNSYIVS